MQVKSKQPPVKAPPAPKAPAPAPAPLMIVPPEAGAPATRPPTVIPAKLDIDTTNPRKHFRTLHGLAVLAELSYVTDEKKLKDILGKLGFDDVKLYGWDRGTIQAMVLTRGDDVFVVYRGTQETKDIFTDLRVWPKVDDALTAGGEVAFDGARIHSGVRASRDRVWNPGPGTENGKALERAQLKPLVDLLRDEAAKGRRISFIGHSLGGGLATSSAAALSAQKHPKTGEPILAHRVVTLGSLRTGNDAFVDAYDKRLAHRTIPVHHHTDAVRSTPKWGYDRQTAEGMTLYLPKASSTSEVLPDESHCMGYYLDGLKRLADAEATGGLGAHYRLMSDLDSYARIPMQQKIDKEYMPDPRQKDVSYIELLRAFRLGAEAKAGGGGTPWSTPFNDR